ncbi:cupin-like domain-containing protein [Novosphingobium sp.]|uniref:cupin-like domain-containing protein n=1 Tax=Novosphingobium sp. TaxID=1874826 RepID=UPI0031CE0864
MADTLTTPPGVMEIEAAKRDPSTWLETLTAGARPVILRGLVSDWPLCHAARQSPEALCAMLTGFASPQMAEVFLADQAVAGRYFYGEKLEGFNFTRMPTTVAGALTTIMERMRDPALGSAYLGSLPTPAYLPGLADANPLPGMVKGVQPRIWIGTASHIAAHYDAVDNLACVVAGHRRFTLYPPQAIADLYAGPIDHTLAGQPVSMATEDPDHPERYPNFPRAREQALTADLEPGDALYLPKLWWHQVDAEAPFNALVNYWWDAHATGPDAPMLSMLLAMITIAERPQAERDAFRAFFEHYVFRGQGHPLAHLPEDQRGVLANIDRAAYGRIRATIMREMRDV